MKDKISLAEWSFIAIVCGALLGVGIASQPPKHTRQYLKIKQAPFSVDVLVKGEVEHPGNYQLPHGATVQDALLAASPKSSANLEKFKKTTRLKQGQSLKIPKKKKKMEKRNSSIVEKSAF